MPGMKGFLLGTYCCYSYCCEICVVVSFVILLCGCLVLEIVTVAFLKVCAVTLEMGSSAFGFFVVLTSVITDVSGVLYLALQ